MKEKKHREEKGGKYLEKEYIFFGEWRFDGCTITCDAMCLKYQESKFYQSPGVEKLLTNSQSAFGLISISYLRKHSQTVSTNDSPKATKMQAFSSSFQYLDEITSLRPLRHIGDGSINCYK